MLTPLDLAVLRAAVIYFQEEFGPHGIKAMRPYFAEPVPVEWSPGDLTRLREFLTTCQLRYVACHPERTHVLNKELLTAPHKSHRAYSKSEVRIATVLV